MVVSVLKTDNHPIIAGLKLRSALTGFIYDVIGVESSTAVNKCQRLILKGDITPQVNEVLERYSGDWQVTIENGSRRIVGKGNTLDQARLDAMERWIDDRPGT